MEKKYPEHSEKKMSLIKPVSGRLTVRTTWSNHPHVRTWKFESSVVKFGRLSTWTVRPQRSDRLQFNFRHPPETLVSLTKKLQREADRLSVKMLGHPNLLQ